jgi:hypothetical protein
VLLGEQQPSDSPQVDRRWFAPGLRREFLVPTSTGLHGTSPWFSKPHDFRLPGHPPFPVLADFGSAALFSA